MSLPYAHTYSWAVLTNLRISGEVRFCQTNCAKKLFSPKISLHIIRSNTCSLSSMLMKITPSSASSFCSSFKRGYIIHSHLSWRERSSPSLPTTSPNHFLILGSLTLSLYTQPCCRCCREDQCRCTLPCPRTEAAGPLTPPNCRRG